MFHSRDRPPLGGQIARRCCSRDAPDPGQWHCTCAQARGRHWPTRWKTTAAGNPPYRASQKVRKCRSTCEYCECAHWSLCPQRRSRHWPDGSSPLVTGRNAQIHPNLAKKYENEPQGKETSTNIDYLPISSRTCTRLRSSSFFFCISTMTELRNSTCCS